MNKYIWFKGHEVVRHYHNGMYSCFIVGHGTLKADTLDGIKTMITAITKVKKHDKTNI